MPTTDYLPVATGGSANVDSQSDFVGSGYQVNGFQAGLAQSAQVNKVLRQASMVIAALANIISTRLGISVLDDGNLAALIANLNLALGAGYVAVPYNTTVTFDCYLGNNFQINLGGNVAASALLNCPLGQIVCFIIVQDTTGGWTFAWPSNVPGDVIDTAANKVSVQVFINSAVGLRPLTPMTSS